MAALLCAIVATQAATHAEALELGSPNVAQSVHLDLPATSEATPCDQWGGQRLRRECIMVDAANEAAMLGNVRDQLVDQGWAARPANAAGWNVFAQGSFASCADEIWFRADNALRAGVPAAPEGMVFYEFRYVDRCASDFDLSGEQRDVGRARQ